MQNWSKFAKTFYFADDLFLSCFENLSKIYAAHSFAMSKIYAAHSFAMSKIYAAHSFAMSKIYAAHSFAVSKIYVAHSFAMSKIYAAHSFAVSAFFSFLWNTIFDCSLLFAATTFLYICLKKKKATANKQASTLKLFCYYVLKYTK